MRGSGRYSFYKGGAVEMVRKKRLVLRRFGAAFAAAAIAVSGIVPERGELYGRGGAGGQICRYQRV